MPIEQPQILVLGGAGYIGSHMVYALKRAGFLPIVLDNLSTGHRHALTDVPFIRGNIEDKNLVSLLFRKYHVSAVMHFAAFIEVAESLQYPDKYYQNNVDATLSFLDTMLKHGIKHYIFSSSAAVYGEPQYLPLNEMHRLLPISPYGRSKKIIEDILQECSRAEDLRYAILRYFNAAGADPSGLIGERHDPESHLIPRILKAIHQDAVITIYGTDYPTKDGTCLRDYIHVNDVCSAHLLCLEALLHGRKNLLYNVGTGIGHSIRDVLQTAREITLKSVRIKHAPRRLGDPAILVADSTRIKEDLHWQPQFANLTQIMQHAWQFLVRNNKNK